MSRQNIKSSLSEEQLKECEEKGQRFESAEFQMGRWSGIAGPFLVKGASRCTIGMFCALGDGIHIVTSNHDMNRANVNGMLCKEARFRSPFIDGPVNVGNAVWIGDDVLIMPGVTIGNGACIAAGAVVTNDIPGWSVAMGNPCRVHHLRFGFDMIDLLERIQWWRWPDEKIFANKRFFDADLTQISAEDAAELIVE